jgi:hypothetical protein
MNLYTNIPITENREVIPNTLENNLPDSQTREVLIRWYNTITQQNYFTNNRKILIQKDGLAVGTPTSGLTAEFFLQNLENIHLAHLSNTRLLATSATLTTFC